jgi:HIV Tat-specific factor 1
VVLQVTARTAQECIQLGKMNPLHIIIISTMTKESATTTSSSNEDSSLSATASVADSDAELSLDRRYLYQNPSTGGVSSTTLTVRQLCRMFSPPGAGLSRFNAETQLLLLISVDTYDPDGWKPAREVPVLRHAAAEFYYSQPSASQQQGPLSCRQLSAATVQLEPATIQVYGDSTGKQWTLLKALPDLVAALDAFHDSPPSQQQPIASTTESTTTGDYDVSVMIYDDNKKEEITASDMDTNKIKGSQVKDELEAFLSSTDHLGPKGVGGLSKDDGIDDEEADDGEAYESDGGTKYVKDLRTGNWIHHDLAPPKPPNSTAAPATKNQKTQHANTTTNTSNNDTSSKKKSKKAKFAARNAKCWIYITGLPPDTTEDEVAKFFSKVGIIDLDPESQRPKVKLYRQNTTATSDSKNYEGACKGDASLCYARPESVELALQVLDEAPFRDHVIVSNKQGNPYRIRVERAKFEQHGDTYAKRKKNVSLSQRKVAKLASQQAIDWDDGEINGRLTGGRKGLHIIVLKRMFHPSDWGNDEKKEESLLALLEQKVRTSSEEEFGPVEKITVFSKNPQGIVVVKFTQPGAASDAVKAWNGRSFQVGNGTKARKVEAAFWDGVEDFTMRNDTKEEVEMAKRHDAFGAWIESHAEDELPEEFRLRVEK